MPLRTSFSALRTRHPFRRRTSMKLAAEGSTITAEIRRPPASPSSARAYSSSVICRRASRELK